MRCDRSEDRRRGLGFHEHRSGAAKDGQSVDRADDGTAGREAGVLAVGRKARHRRRPCVRAVQGAPCRASGSFIGVRGDQPCHAARRARTPGRFQAVAAQRGDEDAGGGHAVADDQRGAWPRRPRFHTRLHGHAPRGECSRACCPCRKADRHETHGTRIRRPARRRIGGVHPLQGVHGQAWRHPRPGPALVRPALPRTRGRASGAGRRGAMDRP